MATMTQEETAPAVRRIQLARQTLVFALLLMLLVVAFTVSLCVGRFSVPAGRALELIWQGISDPSRELAAIDERIVLLVRAPRVVLAALAGAGLAISGAGLQGVFRNPLVSPDILGISQGAAFGGALAIMLGIWGFPLIAMVFLCGMAAVILVGLLSRINGRSETVTVILSGLVISSMFSAVVSLLQFIADPNTSLPAIVYWLMGSFATATWERTLVAAPGLILGSCFLWMLRFRLNILSLDEAEARSLGANTIRERWLVFCLIAVIVGSQVAVSGIIGWIGIVIPHAARLLVGHDHRALLPAAAVLGAGFMVCIDTLARTATAAEIPLGVITALVGAPIFAALLRHHYRERTGS
ncbi:FecCD family ABC transporter permease [Rhizobium leguminosarum]|uniref:FecCD family ABC transporter permease n=1 Tax=Rhizobium leguminosarum TaxID=384 RepID=UPI0013BE3FDA|nr:iron ABC transporter permease [Rhizobium leguminosarum]MBY5321847.1 iron ABC transporter permease [Rhizobium leguminosarum]MBY5385124.1 iron ABC transporter permease [Rhizobium leguminosarum]MBY5423120.1 iron ABC transporter permease [Rhizobium leguminosarum]MCA2433585.1 iron ABC transporter permease [Rhizobium leguminosarum]NEH44556.1 iron chelate uptake ABC transporter family permease subunit [Rhizobium leguminosarum]